MRALTQSGFAGDVRPDRPSTETQVSTLTKVLQVAVNIVFGTPFIWCLLYAVRGPSWWGSHRVFGDAIGRNSALIWVVVAALGSLWLGVSLVFAPIPARRFIGAILIVGATALLMGLHP